MNPKEYRDSQNVPWDSIIEKHKAAGGGPFKLDQNEIQAVLHPFREISDLGIQSKGTTIQAEWPKVIGESLKAEGSPITFDRPPSGEPATHSRIDPIVEAVREDLLKRSQLGIAKYGTTLAENNAGRQEWLQHIYEELLDAANYLKRLMKEEEKNV